MGVCAGGLICVRAGGGRGAGCGMVLDACSNMQKLEHLDLSSNSIGGDGRRSLFTSLPSCPSLKVLVMEGNSLSDHDMQALADAVARCGITTLRLARNSIADAGAASLAAALKKSRSLTAVDLSTNGIGDCGVEVLGEALAALPHLTSLNLSHNPFTPASEAALRAAAPASLSLEATPAPPLPEESPKKKKSSRASA
jgi:Ran GTPase-activating protein (RanGAP) involved in mRNA processing and transport